MKKHDKSKNQIEKMNKHEANAAKAAAKKQKQQRKKQKQQHGSKKQLQNSKSTKTAAKDQKQQQRSKSSSRAAKAAAKKQQSNRSISKSSLAGCGPLEFAQKDPREGVRCGWTLVSGKRSVSSTRNIHGWSRC